MGNIRDLAFVMAAFSTAVCPRSGQEVRHVQPVAMCLKAPCVGAFRAMSHDVNDVTDGGSSFS